MLTAWASKLNPLLANHITQGLAITGIVLNSGVPMTIPTGLSRMQQGWFITDKLAYADIQRIAPFNSNNLTLEANADTTISIWVY